MQAVMVLACAVSAIRSGRLIVPFVTLAALLAPLHVTPFSRGACNACISSRNYMQTNTLPNFPFGPNKCGLCRAFGNRQLQRAPMEALPSEPKRFKGLYVLCTRNGYWHLGNRQIHKQFKPIPIW